MVSNEVEKDELEGCGVAEGGAFQFCHETTRDARDAGRIDCDSNQSVHSSVRTVTDSLKHKQVIGSGAKGKYMHTKFSLSNTYLGRSAEFMEGNIAVVEPTTIGELKFNTDIHILHHSRTFESYRRFFLLRNSNVTVRR